MAVAVPAPDLTLTTGPTSVLKPWLDRTARAEKHRKQFEAQWMTSQHFAAGKQWIAYAPRRHRVLVPELPKGRSRQTADVLTQYVWSVIGELAADDFRPQFLFSHDDAPGEDYATIVNKALEYGWDHEWDGDNVLHDLLLKLAIFGTAAIRCRYDKTQGPVVAHDVPHQDGQPLLDKNQQAQYMEQRFVTGQKADLRTVREGRVVWEPLSPWQILPPPGVEHDRDFPWEIIVRAVPVDTVRRQYGNAAAGLKAEGVDAMDSLGMVEAPTEGDRQGSYGKLEDHVLVYTGHLRPTLEFPDGQTCVFTKQRVLDSYEGLPYPENGGRPASTGITYFKWWPVPQRFWGRGFIEPGIGPQRTRNKRLTQIDEIIDRGLPKVYAEKGAIPNLPAGLAVEVIEVSTGKSIPHIDQGVPVGPWMVNDIQMHDANIEKALGVHQPSIGGATPGVTAYSALALQSERDSRKLGPIAKRFHLGVDKVATDSLEAMRNWPPGKRLLIAGDDDTLEVHEFDATSIPSTYMVKPAKGAVQIRSQGAETQKIFDIFTQAAQTGQTLPLSWLVDSLEAGKAQPLPDKPADEQRHKAALENALMLHGSGAPPVAPYDDAQVHVPEHTQQQVELANVPGTEQVVATIEQHKQLHLQQAQANAAQNLAGGVPPPGGGAAPPAALPPAAAPVPAPAAVAPPGAPPLA